MQKIALISLLLITGYGQAQAGYQEINQNQVLGPSPQGIIAVGNDNGLDPQKPYKE